MKKNYALTLLLLWFTAFAGFAQATKEEIDLTVINKIKQEEIGRAHV